MGLSDFWRGNRGRDREEWRQREQDWRSRQGNQLTDEEGEGFGRRGWREGSDYYGNDPERYGSGNYDSYATRREEAELDRGRPSFNDRWQNAYGSSGSQSNFRGYGGYGGDNYGDRGTYGGYGRGQFGARAEQDSWRDDDFSRAQGQFRGRGPKGYRRSDERIREDVCECLTDDERIDATNVSVGVKDCEVTLSGTVSSREEKRRAESLIERLSGVKDVHNQLRVAPEAESGSAAASGDAGKDLHH